MKSALAFVIVFSCLFVSCRKKEEKVENPVNGSGTTTSASTGPITTDAKIFHVFLGTELNLHWNGDSIYGSARPYAYFNKVALAAPDPTSGIEVSSVKMNENQLPYLGKGLYAPPVGSFMAPTLDEENWDVVGNNGIPSFTLQNTTIRPSGLNPAVFPDTIFKAIGFSLNLGTLSGVRSGSITIIDGTLDPGKSIIKLLSNGPQSFSLSASQLSDFHTEGKGTIIVQLENSKGVIVQGKNFMLTKLLTSYKDIVVSD